MKKYKKDDFIGRGFCGLVMVIIFCLGLIAGAGFVYHALNAQYYDEVRAADSAIWIRIEAFEGDRGDLFERVDHLARSIDQFDLAVAQIIVYENRQEIMNVRISTED